jgi:hypothetical protein
MEIALGVVSDLENYGTQPPAAPPNGAKLFGIVVLLVDQIGLVKNLLSFFETNVVFAFNFRILSWLKGAARI